MYNPEKITYFGETDSRNKRVAFGIKAKDRLKHVYVIGKTGMGKSTLLENMAVQDIKGNEGMAFIDPHGKTAELLLEYVPPERIKDVVYFAPFDIEHPISFNVMEDVGPDKRHLVVNGLMSAFKKLFGEESFSDRMQYILQNTILALLEYPESTMLGINRMLTDKAYRDKVIANVTDSSVKTYWTQEFANYTERFAAEATPAIQNKIGQFTANPLVRNIIGQPKSSFDFRKLMDEGKIMIINLSKGRVGEANANLLGSMLITKIYLAAMSRADTNEVELNKLPNFYLYVDEFQSFANESFADILSEARKYKLNLTVAHQYIEQMSEEVRAAVFGNVGTMITFRVGAYDAEVLEKEFAPVFTMEDLVNLGSYQIYLKLMIDGIGSQPFSARTLPPIAKPDISNVSNILESSRTAFARPRDMVEKIIAEWYEEGKPPEIRPPKKPTSAYKERRPDDRRSNDHQTRSRSEDDYELKQVKQIRHEVVASDQRIAPKDDFKPLKSISLERLKEKSSNQRPASEKNVNDLRSALSSIVKNTPAHTPAPVVAPKPAPAPVPAPVTPPTPPNPPLAKGREEGRGEPKAKEIPREELEKLLSL
ncbi:type IV secretion system DNA-binding domain-containing protein [Candidatus Parcubacteria bacterium]|nr:type IV secretion system DNA-binding domain-containing protein [Candidatus Parcubacteria bacterium]